MKKIILIILIVLGLFMTYVSGYAAENTVNPASKKVAIVYFSTSGSTKRVAEIINSNTESDIFEIIPEIPYTSDDYSEEADGRVSKEFADLTLRPAIKNKIDISQYDTIFLGYPIWRGKAPRIMTTFVESNNLEGKVIIPFVTSGNVGIGSSAVELSKESKGATWKEGKRFSSNTSNDEVKNWIKTLGF